MKKPDYPIWKTEVSTFGSFRNESRKKAKQGNVKIEVYLRHGNGK
jgi:hypothetical protein